MVSGHADRTSTDGATSERNESSNETADPSGTAVDPLQLVRLEPVACAAKSAPYLQAPKAPSLQAPKPPQAPLTAVTSISIFIRGSARPASIIVAAGLTSPNARFSTGQHAGKSAADGRM